MTPKCRVLSKRKVTAFTAVARDRTIRGAVSDYPLHWTVWNLSLSRPDYKYLCNKNAESTQILRNASNWAYNVTRRIPAELRGALTFASPSFQLTACVLLADFPLPKALYDGLRIISLGNFYDVPSW